MKRILLVDDEISIFKDGPFGQKILKAAKKHKIDIDFVDKPEKAIEIINSDIAIDLVLMDGQFKNSHLQGPEAVAEIRRFCNIPIIMISGSKSINEEGLTKGANDFLDKMNVPADLNKKSGKIQKALALEWNRVRGSQSKYLTSRMLQEVGNKLLPLHIDMETLSILHERGESTDEFLKEMYEDNIDYLQKLKDVRSTLSGITSGITEDYLTQLLYGPNVESFFHKLSEKTGDPEILLKHDWQIDNVHSFQGWFEALMETLRSMLSK